MSKKQQLTPIDTASSLLLQDAIPLNASETVRIEEALGRILAIDICSSLFVPPSDNSAMDGYAICFDDLAQASEAAFIVSQRISAGAVGVPLERKTAARIFTGAEIPPGADTVIMQEQAKMLPGGTVKFSGLIDRNQHIRPKGQDIAAGQTILKAGHTLRAQDLGLIASVGINEVAVYRPLTVALISTGNELVDPGQSISPGQIYNSNRYTLLGLLKAAGYAVIDYGVVPDSAEATADVLRDAAGKADCIISSGGVSVGEEDHLRAQIEALGELKLWKIAIKPGKPLAYGHVQNTPFIGLPGNPVAAYVTFRLVAQPYLAKRQGAREYTPVPIAAHACFELSKKAKRQQYLSVRVNGRNGELIAELYPNQSSGVLSSLSWANALAIVPIGVTVSEGDTINVLLLEEPFT